MDEILEQLRSGKLNYFEEALLYQKLREEYGLKQTELAELLGITQSTVANKLRLLKFGVAVREEMMSLGISERHARAVLALSDKADAYEIIKKISAEGLTVKETEELVAEENKKSEEAAALPKSGNQVIHRYVRSIKLFTNSVRQAAAYMKESGVDVDITENQTEDMYEMIVRVPLQ